jgi:hypothetical protein
MEHRAGNNRLDGTLCRLDLTAGHAARMIKANPGQRDLTRH